MRRQQIFYFLITLEVDNNQWLLKQTIKLHTTLDHNDAASVTKASFFTSTHHQKKISIHSFLRLLIIIPKETGKEQIFFSHKQLSSNWALLQTITTIQSYKKQKKKQRVQNPAQAQSVDICEEWEAKKKKKERRQLTRWSEKSPIMIL